MIRNVLIANRGEIAIRIARACATLGLRAVAVFARDDAASLHVRRADVARALPGVGVAAYLDADALISAARAEGCDAVHPGYGFLSENAGFASACARAELVFVGPSRETLELLGDKLRARALAVACGVAVPRGAAGDSEVDAAAFLGDLGAGGAVMVKAVAGGGGRGMRVVRETADLAEAWARCAAEARAAFGDGRLYVEELVGSARHVEVQVAGDILGAVCTIGDRDCSLQRRHQKLIEIAPAPNLSPACREGLAEAALGLAARSGLANLATFEFLVRPDGSFAFIEANPRLQVEHTATEEAFGIDLVAAQLRLADGVSLQECGLLSLSPRWTAVQARVNLETMAPDGSVLPQTASITAYEPPAGPGLRVDGAAYAGYTPSASFDSLAAKVIARAPEFAAAARLAERALAEFRLEGPRSNLALLSAILRHDDFAAGAVTTDWLDRNLANLLQGAAAQSDEQAGPDDAAIRAPATGTVVSVDVQPGATIRAGQTICVLEAMKMQIVVAAPHAGTIGAVHIRVGDVVQAGAPVAGMLPAEETDAAQAIDLAEDLDAMRPDLADLQARLSLTLDAFRQDAIERRHAQGGRTARENVADLLDPGSFREYGALAIAAQRTRRSVEDLRRSTPADGLLCGIGTIGADEVGEARATTLVAAYDYTVLAGTQGAMNHKKLDRLLGVAADLRHPLVLLAEGGGGRPGDTDMNPLSAGGLDTPTFAALAQLSGKMPLVGVVHGSCFAGNAALLGCCDVIISTRASNTGMGGPAMIEGGGLGSYTAAEIGPAESQWANGVIDVLVDDEAQAIAQARRYVGYFQGACSTCDCADQRVLRRLVPEQRQRAYDIRRVTDALCDSGSVLELRRGFGAGLVTALARIGGLSVGVIANNPLHLGGAIDADAADKGARFLGLCDAHGLPIVSLCDTPGFMVGPESERAAHVRHAGRLFLRGANLSVPIFTVVLRKGYGLGAMAMAGGGFHRPVFTIAWPSGEFGGMGLEGAVRLGYRRELAAIDDLQARETERRRLTAELYARGRAISAAEMLEFDAVIDPAETRDWLLRGLKAAPAGKSTQGFVDSW